MTHNITYSGARSVTLNDVLSMEIIMINKYVLHFINKDGAVSVEDGSGVNIQSAAAPWFWKRLIKSKRLAV